MQFVTLQAALCIYLMVTAINCTPLNSSTTEQLIKATAAATTTTIAVEVETKIPTETQKETVTPALITATTTPSNTTINGTNTTTTTLKMELNKNSKKPHYTYGHDGEPGCRTEEEINRSWRNNFDPARFWFCDKLNTPAIDIECPGGAYQNAEIMCVPWNLWEWTQPQDPPTLAHLNDDDDDAAA